MNVLHIVANMDPQTGGVCQAVRTIVDGLTRRGIHNEVATVDTPDAPYLSRYTFPVHALGPSDNGWHYSARLLPWLTDNLDRFDAVIVHGLWLYHSHAVCKAIAQRRQQPNARAPRFFVMPHGMLDPWFQKASGRRIKAIRNWAYWKLIENKVINEADGLLFTCQTELLLAREPFSPYRPARELNVGHGIADVPTFDPAMQAAFRERCPTLGDAPYLLFLSRIDTKKGVDLLIDAYAALQLATGTAVLPKLVVAGPGLDSVYGNQIRQQVTQSPALANAVLFPGMLTGDAKWGAFYGCQAFVLPSHQENFGIAVVEALACGKPVLISDQVNIWREIDAMDGGLIGSDTQAGTQQLLENWLALSAGEQRQMGQRARQTFRHHFAIDPATDRLIDALILNVHATTVTHG
jgi:glycosyltransferase involved in cell wall biosynthesis